MAAMEVLAALFAVIAVAGIYFFPAVIAFMRHHHQRAAILIFNLLLGWTALGWVLALVWSFTATADAKPEIS